MSEEDKKKITQKVTTPDSQKNISRYDEDFKDLCKEEILQRIKEIDYDFYGFQNDDISNSQLKTLSTFTLCLDIRKSTDLMSICRSAKIYSDFVSAFINSCKETIINRNAIYDKFTGDGVLCHFIEEVDENSYLNCIKCSIELHNKFKRIYKEYLDDKKFKLDLLEAGIGIGIDYGQVFFRMIKGQEFFAIGESVNYACRLSCAPAYKTYLNTNAKVRIKKDKESLYEFTKKPLNIKVRGEINIYSLCGSCTNKEEKKLKDKK